MNHWFQNLVFHSFYVASVCWWIPSSHHTVSSRTCYTSSHTRSQCLPKNSGWLSLEFSDILFCIVNLSFSLFIPSASHERRFRHPLKIGIFFKALCRELPDGFWKMSWWRLFDFGCILIYLRVPIFLEMSTCSLLIICLPIHSPGSKII